LNAWLERRDECGQAGCLDGNGLGLRWSRDLVMLGSGVVGYLGLLGLGLGLGL
jgi:hypothetical protein